MKEPGEFLPLHRNRFLILLSLAEADRHGYAISKDVERRTQGRVVLWPATLYGGIRRLLKEGLIDSEDGPPDADARRRYYRVTDLGLDVLLAESRRLQSMADMARRAWNRRREVEG